MSLPEDLTGARFGRLVAIRHDPTKSKGNGAYWECLCDCGKRVTVIASSLKRGNTRSCGCLRRDQLDNIDRSKISHKKHGAYTKQTQIERLYSVWKGMKARCYQKKHYAYKYYGGRGIAICAECRKWDSNSGLTARRCAEWGRFTTQHEFCSRGSKWDA